jgi:hypothetical protein
MMRRVTYKSPRLTRQVLREPVPIVLILNLVFFLFVLVHRLGPSLAFTPWTVLIRRIDLCSFFTLWDHLPFQSERV